VGQMPNESNIDALCLQKIDLENGYPWDTLNLGNQEVDIETNSVWSRVGVYIKKVS
jgi:hypothetical protein